MTEQKPPEKPAEKIRYICESALRRNEITRVELQQILASTEVLLKQELRA